MIEFNSNKNSILCLTANFMDPVYEKGRLWSRLKDVSLSDNFPLYQNSKKVCLLVIFYLKISHKQLPNGSCSISQQNVQIHPKYYTKFNCCKNLICIT